MAETVFVNRDQEQLQLRQLLTETAQGRGRTAAISGSAGIGKSFLVQELERWAGHQDASASSCRVVRVPCYSGIGEVNAYGPLLELFHAFQERKRRRRFLGWGKRTWTEAGPELISLVPVAGPFLKAGALATKAAFDGGDGAGGEHAGLPLAAAVRQSVCEAVLALVADHGPLVVVVEDAHNIDTSSSLALRRLVPETDSTPLSFVFTYRPEEVGRDHPLRDLLYEVDLRGDLLELELKGFSRPAVSEYVSRASGEVNSPAVVDWLASLTGGHPILLAQYLKLLQERSAMHLLATAASPSSLNVVWPERETENGEPSLLPRKVEIVLHERIKHIDSEARRLLVIGATQGERFMSAVVEKVSGRSRDEVLHCLHRVSRDFGVIRPAKPSPWVAGIGSDYYAFDHSMLRLAFYGLQSPQARRDRHVAIGRFLDDLTEEFPNAPQEIFITVSRHHSLGGRPVQAAQRAVHSARALAIRSSSFDEAAGLCHQALEEVRKVSPPTAEADRLRVEAIELLLVMSALRWKGRAEDRHSSRSVLVDLAAEASTAAARTGDDSLVARALFLEGKTLLRTAGVNSALPKLRAAVELTTGGNDSAAHFIATAEYGHHLAKQDLAAGLRYLRDAEEMYRRTPELGASDDPTVAQIVDEARLQLGVNNFDDGNFGEASSRLHACIDSLRNRSRFQELPCALNYLAQMHIACGDQEAAATALREAIAIDGERPDSRTGWYGYNLALLGRTMAQLGELSDACRLVEEGWNEARLNWLADLVPIVRIHHAEVSLAVADRTFTESAEEMLRAALEESGQSGLPRSEVNALMLLARLLLHRGDVPEALAHSMQAVSLLEQHGRLSTVRSEEVYLHHARVLAAAGREPDTREWIERARREVRRKAESFSEESERIRFEQGEEVNKLVSTAFRHGIGAVSFTRI